MPEDRGGGPIQHFHSVGSIPRCANQENGSVGPMCKRAKGEEQTGLWAQWGNGLPGRA